MDKLKTPNDVRRYYLKAANIVHPDKVQHIKNVEILYIANKCFAALNEANELFKKEEGL